MDIIVFTSDQNNHLLAGFCHQFNKHWKMRGSRFPDVYVVGHRYPSIPLPMNFSFVSMGSKSPDANQWSTYVREFIRFFRKRSLTAVIMLEDYWLTNDVDGQLVYSIYGMIDQWRNVLRIDLTADRSTRRHTLVSRYGDFTLIDSDLKTDYLMSYQTGIWNLEHFLRVTKDGENPWQSEINGTERIRTLGELRIFGTLEHPVKYQPIYRSRKNLYQIDRIPAEDLVELDKKGFIPWVKSTEAFPKQKR